MDKKFSKNAGNKKKRIYLPLISALSILIAFGLVFFYVFYSQPPDVLNCKQATDAMRVLSPEASNIFDGNAVSTFYEKLQTMCESGKVKSLDFCNTLTDSLEVCPPAFGILAKNLKECSSNEQCTLSFASSHIKNCDNFLKGSSKNACFFAKANITKNRKYCDKIQQIKIDQNLLLEGIREGNKEKIAENYLNRYKCLWGISDLLNDSGICDSMENSFEKNICYFSYAVKNSDESFCKKISSDQLTIKVSCSDVINKRVNASILEKGLLNL